MNYVFVKFSGTVKNYLYKTKLNLMKGARPIRLLLMGLQPMPVL